MNHYMALIYEIPAAVALGPLVVNLLPFSIDKRLNPLVMFLSVLAVMFLPLTVALALASCIPVGYAYGLLGVKLQGHEPFTFPVEKARALIHVARESLRREEAVDAPLEDILTTSFPSPVDKYVPAL